MRSGTLGTGRYFTRVTAVVHPHTGDSGAKARATYKGPRLADLTLEDLRRRECPWQAFLRGSEGTAWRAAYNLPEHVAHLCARCEENVVYYLVSSC